MSKVIDSKGQKFGRLTVLERAPSTGGQAEWICKCKCGNIKTYGMALSYLAVVLIRKPFPRLIL